MPQRWLMTDARLGGDIPAIIANMPPRSAVVVRPQALGRWGTPALLRHYRRVARAKRHLLLISGRPSAAYDGAHINRHATPLIHAGHRSMAVHDRRQADVARRLGVQFVLISPVWATLSHPGAATLGLRGLRRLAARALCPVVALGGVVRTNAHLVRRHGAQGWAAIGAWQSTSQ